MEEAKFKFITGRFKNIIQREEESEDVERIAQINVDEIMPNPYQPRRHFEISSLEELAASVKEVGVITPITVRRAACGYELVCGERRLRAAKMAGLKTVPACIADLSDRDSAVAAITENLQRRDLSFFEEAESIKNLMDFHGMTQEEAAKKLGKSQAAIANKIRLLKLSEEAKHIVTEGGLCERHARALLRLPTAQMQTSAAEKAVQYQMNVAATEKMVQKMLEEEPKKKLLKKDATYEKSCRLFKNTVGKTVEMLKKSGISPEITENEQEDYIEYKIRLNKSAVLANLREKNNASTNVSRETMMTGFTENTL